MLFLSSPIVHLRSHGSLVLFLTHCTDFPRLQAALPHSRFPYRFLSYPHLIDLSISCPAFFNDRQPWTVEPRPRCPLSNLHGLHSRPSSCSPSPQQRPLLSHPLYQRALLILPPLHLTGIRGCTKPLMIFQRYAGRKMPLTRCYTRIAPACSCLCVCGR